MVLFNQSISRWAEMRREERGTEDRQHDIVVPSRWLCVSLQKNLAWKLEPGWEAQRNASLLCSSNNESLFAIADSEHLHLMIPSDAVPRS